MTAVPVPAPDYRAAQRHLARRHPAFARTIKAVGPCTLQPDPDHYAVLLRCIVSQQISTRAAASIGARIHQAVAATGLTPAGVHAATDEALRGCGLSGSKLRAIRALTTHVRETVPDLLATLATVPDAEVAKLLLPIRGIGPWTVDMFLMFGLGRPDVLPVGDLGLRAGVKDLFGLEEVPGPAELQKLAEPWRPYRTIATWYVWRSRGFVPQSGAEPPARASGRRKPPDRSRSR